MKKTNAHKGLDIFRWVVLLPAVCFTWCCCAMICAWIEHFFYSPVLGNVFIVLDLLILPTIAVFFVSRIIAPKYKKHIGYIVMVLSVLWFVLLIYGLSRMAY